MKMRCVVEPSSRVLLFDQVESSKSLSKSVMNPIDTIESIQMTDTCVCCLIGAHKGRPVVHPYGLEGRDMLHISHTPVAQRVGGHRNHEDDLGEAGDGPVTPAGGITRVPGIRGTPKERSQSAYDIPAPNPVARATGQPRPVYIFHYRSECFHVKGAN